MEASIDCPSTETLVRYISGEDGLEDVASHVGKCLACSSFVVASSASSIDQTIRAVAAGGAARFVEEPGRYRVDEPIARGSFGAVHRGYDTQLRRVVAIKRIRQDLDKPSLEALVLRFEIEARITGFLQHPGVMPIHSLGRDELGWPFYVMPLIQDRTLRSEIDSFHSGLSGLRRVQRSLAFRELLGRFLIVCRAVEFAHQKGVIHRDLKPDNVLVGALDETLVADWGVARFLSEDAAREAGFHGNSPLVHCPNVTDGGRNRVGSIPYMSPEAACEIDDPVGVRSDVHGLGVMLAELVTGRLPIGDSPRRPFHPDSAPLLSIAARAMQFAPGARYPSVAAFIAEIDRWLGDEPVRDHVEPYPRRVARWSRKHPAWAATIAATLTLVAFGSVGFAVYESAMRDQIQRQSDRADQQRRLARSHLTRFLDAILDNVRTVSNESLLQPDGQKVLRFKLLDESRTEIERSQDSVIEFGDADLIERLAQLRHNLGMIYFRQGRNEAAAREFDSAILLGRKLVASRAGEAEPRATLAFALYRRGRLAHAMKDRPIADRMIRESLDVLNVLTGPKYAFERFEIMAAWSAILKDRQDPAAFESLLAALAVYRNEVDAKRKAIPNNQRVYAGNLLNLAVLDLESATPERLARSEATAREARDILDPLARSEPDSIEDSFRAIQAEAILGEIKDARGESGAALAAYRGAVVRLEAMNRRWPADVPIRQQLDVLRQAVAKADAAASNPSQP